MGAIPEVHVLVPRLIVLLLVPAVCYAYFSCDSQMAVCDRQWEKIYEHDEHGAELYGEKKDLKNAVLRGASIRILLHDMQLEPSGTTTHTFTAGPDNINIRGEEICAEIINHVALKDCEFVTNAHYRHFLPCTTGNVHVAQYLVESASFLGQDTQKVRISWFAKDIQADVHNSRPFYGHFLDGGSTVGKMSELLRSAKEGKELRALMTDRGYGFPLQVVMWSRDGRVSGQSNMHLSQKYSGNNIVFNTQTPYNWFSSWSTGGRRDSSRWAVGGKTNRGRGSDYVSLNWFVDPCWQHVYTNDEYGQAADGSLQMLTAAVQSGHRVRVVMSNFAMEANFVRIKNGHMTAYLIDMLSNKGGSGFDEFDFKTDTNYQFKLVHTTGTVRSYGYLVRNASIPVVPIMSKETIRWYVDTRKWHKILETKSNGVATWGMKGNLKSAIRKAARIRMGVSFDVRGGEMFVNADNARVSTTGTEEDASAQAIRILGDQPYNRYEYELSSVAFWVYLCMPTSSAINLSGWKLGEHRRYFQSSKTALTKWFVEL
ncbi:hypothetical protein ACOMHN_029624 [Nucella lapillus]